MLTLDNIKANINSNKCSNCGTSYCSDTSTVFDNNQGITSGMISSPSK